MYTCVLCGHYLLLIYKRRVDRSCVKTMLKVIALLGLLLISLVSATDTSRIRIINAIPSSLPVDISINGLTTFPLLQSGSISNYFVLENYVTQAFLNVTAINGFLLTTLQVSIIPGNSYTIALSGDTKSISTNVLLDDDRAVAKGFGAIRFVNLAGFSPIDVLLRTKDNKETTLFSKVSYNQATPYSKVSVGVYDFGIKLFEGMIVPALANIPITRSVSTIFLVGGADKSKIKVVLALDRV